MESEVHKFVLDCYFPSKSAIDGKVRMPFVLGSSDVPHMSLQFLSPALPCQKYIFERYWDNVPFDATWQLAVVPPKVVDVFRRYTKEHFSKT